jgi:hypothetical protein
MNFFRKNIVNILDRIAIFCIFSSIRFNGCGQSGPCLAKTQETLGGQICTPFSAKNELRGEKISPSPLSFYPWSIPYLDSDVADFKGIENKKDHGVEHPYQNEPRGDNANFLDSDNVCGQKGQGDWCALWPQRRSVFNESEINTDVEQWMNRAGGQEGQEKEEVFGILCDYPNHVCGLFLQKRIRTSFYQYWY